ncbi:hypothetical protein DL98DRAFT_583160 [Cadophora sp. DSE1049]|nr:hypothetical protein DL98DRAFT_583160 [Cadophora sp. DSE1049]
MEISTSQWTVPKWCQQVNALEIAGELAQMPECLKTTTWILIGSNHEKSLYQIFQELKIPASNAQLALTAVDDLDGMENSTGLASYGKELPCGSGGEKCLLATYPESVADAQFVIRYPQALAWAWYEQWWAGDKGPWQLNGWICFGSNRPKRACLLEWCVRVL